MAIESFVNVRGHKIRTLTNGLGSEVMLLHGARFTADTWEQVGTLRRLEEEGIGATAVDFPGYGKSEKGTWNDLGDFLEDLISVLGVRDPVLLGPSMAGRVALRYSLKREVKALILIGAVGIPEVEKELSKLNGKKILLIWGKEDSVSPVENAVKFTKLVKSAELKIIGNQHACYLDDPEGFNREVISFLKTLR
ncbi:alpha/beta hydrolase [Metallosphaera tengchongensis]|uniref:Alpha/beta hydrolase n=1 Tax=Metallosphaera tengchongensis TaxID=1532350 RepID=A0A6N0NSB9_9CREN|nr:alpha/beta hydrolase [Metallosphaera tengchongensis]QKQ99601.1 alpha/beta hydrolase [Metallosphaera tengchongensis]